MAKEQVAQCADCAGVGAEHKMLEPFVGTFKAKVKLWMGTGEPSESTGLMTNTWELGGRFLKQSYQGDPSPGPFGAFEGRGYWGYNTVDKRFEGFWIDTACTFMQNERGSVDAAGKVWKMAGQMTDPQTGASMKKTSIITLKDKDHHSMEVFFSGPDGKEQKCMEIQYQRTR